MMLRRVTPLIRNGVGGVALVRQFSILARNIATSPKSVDNKAFLSQDGMIWQNPLHEWKVSRRYQGNIKAVILDWAGTVLDCGVYSPAVVFVAIFEQEGVPITMEEARLPMGAHKKVHIRKITQIDSVRERWKAAKGRLPTEQDVERMFTNFVPQQLKVLPKYTDMIPGAVETTNSLKKMGIKIGSTTGFTTPMVQILKEAAEKSGYKPDCIVCADQVPQARPFPYMVWQNAIRLDVWPISAIVKVDDTADGVSEGINAGCWTVGLARSGNYMGMNEIELNELQRNDPERYGRMIRRSYDILSAAGAHYVVDDISQLIPVINHINLRLATAAIP